MKRKTLTILLVFLLLFAFIGCGKKEHKERTTRIMTTEEVTEAEVATPEEATPEAKKATPDDATKSDAMAKEESTTEAETTEEPTTEGPVTNGKVIVLDPGHSSVVRGGTEPIGPGASEQKAADSSGTRGVSTGLTEYELNFQIATKLQVELEARGYTVLLTRYDNETGISCSERAAIANNAGADVFLRIHADGSDSASASGAMGICITPSNPYIASQYSESRRLSDCILNEYVASTGLSSRGVWETDTMTGNNWAIVPTTLLEMGLMTNPNEDSLMADEEFQNRMVQGIANGVDRFCFTD